MLSFHDKTADSFFFDTFLTSTYKYKAFIDIPTKNKVIYNQVAREKEAKI